MFLGLDKKDKNKIAVIDSNNQSVTYGELVEFCNSFSLKYSLERQVAFILCRNNIETLMVYIACLANRIVPLMISADLDAHLLDNLKNQYSPRYMFGLDKDICECGKKIKMAIKGAESDYCLIRMDGASISIYTELSLLLMTSGSTGSPKLVRHSYFNIETQANNVATFFEITEEDRPLLNLPLMYTMGLSIANSYLLRGATILLTDESILSKNFLNFIRKEQVTAITGVPYTYELLKRVGLERMNLTSLNMLSQGGGKLRPELQQDFASYIIGKGGKYIATYGQTEGTARMAYLPSEYALTKVGSIGRAIPGGSLYLMDEKMNRITEPNIEGELYYEGPNVTLGYAECIEDLTKGDERKGRLATGDLAIFDEDGMYYITGRKKRFLKLFGHRVGLDECEAIIKDTMNIDSACVGNDSKLVVYVAKNDYREDIKKVLAERTGLYAHGIDIRVIQEIPRTEAGKIRYSSLEV